MDYKKLLKPYSEGGRTLEGQIAWLMRKGIPKVNIDQALVYIYDEIERGKVYANGHTLDRTLLDKAQEYLRADADSTVKQLEQFHDALRRKWGEDLQKMAEAMRKKSPLWVRILTLGFKK